MLSNTLITFLADRVTVIVSFFKTLATLAYNLARVSEFTLQPAGMVLNLNFSLWNWLLLLDNGLAFFILD